MSLTSKKLSLLIVGLYFFVINVDAFSQTPKPKLPTLNEIEEISLNKTAEIWSYILSTNFNSWSGLSWKGKGLLLTGLGESRRSCLFDFPNPPKEFVFNSQKSGVDIYCKNSFDSNMDNLASFGLFDIGTQKVFAMSNNAMIRYGAKAIMNLSFGAVEPNLEAIVTFGITQYLVHEVFHFYQQNPLGVGLGTSNFKAAFNEYLDPENLQLILAEVQFLNYIAQSISPESGFKEDQRRLYVRAFWQIRQIRKSKFPVSTANDESYETKEGTAVYISNEVLSKFEYNNKKIIQLTLLAQAYMAYTHMYIYDPLNSINQDTFTYLTRWRMYATGALITKAYTLFSGLIPSDKVLTTGIANSIGDLLSGEDLKPVPGLEKFILSPQIVGLDKIEDLRKYFEVALDEAKKYISPKINHKLIFNTPNSQTFSYDGGMELPSGLWLSNFILKSDVLDKLTSKEMGFMCYDKCGDSPLPFLQPFESDVLFLDPDTNSEVSFNSSKQFFAKGLLIKRGKDVLILFKSPLLIYNLPNNVHIIYISDENGLKVETKVSLKLLDDSFSRYSTEDNDIKLVTDYVGVLNSIP